MPKFHIHLQTVLQTRGARFQRAASTFMSTFAGRSNNWLSQRSRTLFRKKAADTDLDAEVSYHLQNLISQNISQGLTPEEARRQAIQEFGGPEFIKQQCRDARPLQFLESLLQDATYGLRILRSSPAFTTVAVLSLALGIGANTAIFTLIDAIMLRALPVTNPSELVLLQKTYDGKPSNFSYPAFEHLRDHNQVFSGMIATSYMNQPKVEFNGEPATANLQMVSSNFYDVLGVRALVGRTFSGHDQREPVAVIGYRYWKRRFALDPQVIGKTLTVNGTQFTIIGVTPPEFFGVQIGRPLEIAIPLTLDAQVRGGKSWLRESASNWLYLMARLQPGIGIRQAQADTAVLFRQQLAATMNPKSEPRDHRLHLAQQIEISPGASGLSWLRREFSEPLEILMAVVVLVLLIACANIANLQLARGKARAREFAVRMAVGAGRARLIRQLLTESALLAVSGAALGLLFARWAGHLLVVLMSRSQSEVTLAFGPDLRVLSFTAAVTLVTVMLSGLAPARAATSSLRSRHTGLRVGKTLVVSQVAISVLLLIGAGLFVRTLANLQNLDAGFDRANLLMFSLDAQKAGYRGERAAQLYRDVLDRIRSVPQVRSASLSLLTPITGGGIYFSLSAEGYAARPDEDRNVYYNAVGPGFFATMGTPLLAGREFGPQDGESSKVAIINQGVARRFFANVNPLGRRVTIANQPPREVVGVVKDAKYLDLRLPEPPTVYVPFTPVWGPSFELRVAAAPSVMPNLIRARVREIDPKLPIGEFKTLAAQINESLVNERLVAAFSSVFGALALVLAAIGLYGIMAYAVVRRTNEIGIRMALGAAKRDVIWMVLQETLLLVAAGIAAGVPAALACARLVSHRLFGLKPADPPTIAAAVLVMAAVAALAGYLPARRASQVDPMTALRFE